MCSRVDRGRQARRFHFFEVLEYLHSYLLVGWNPDQGDNFCLKALSKRRVDSADHAEVACGKSHRRGGCKKLLLGEDEFERFDPKVCHAGPAQEGSLKHNYKITVGTKRSGIGLLGLLFSGASRIG
jgi:hypothetical protein